MKYYVVKFITDVSKKLAGLLIKKTEVVSAKNEEAVFKDYLERYGEYLMEYSIKEIPENQTPRYAKRIYIVM